MCLFFLNCKSGSRILLYLLLHIGYNFGKRTSEVYFLRKINAKKKGEGNKTRNIISVLCRNFLYSFSLYLSVNPSLTKTLSGKHAKFVYLCALTDVYNPERIHYGQLPFSIMKNIELL